MRALDSLQVRNRRQRVQVGIVERKKPSRRRVEFIGSRDPRMVETHYYVEQFVESSWHDVYESCGWRPIDAEARRWLAEFNRLNGRK